MKIRNGSKLVFIGDSVTDCGRKQPVGEGLFGPYGAGYVNIVAGHLGAVAPGANIRVVNMGTSGNTVRDLKARWQTDVFDQKPTWLSIMIGVNDVWRQFDCPLETETHVLPAEYEETLDELVRTTQPTVEGLVLMTPHYLEPNPADPMRARMDEYGAIVKRIAAKYNTLLVDTQAAFECVLANTHSTYIAWDRVHPNIIGHTVLARAFLSAVDALS